jgi:hypothetical protein
MVFIAGWRQLSLRQPLLKDALVSKQKGKHEWMHNVKHRITSRELAL